jgi:hypothetical protein
MTMTVPGYQIRPASLIDADQVAGLAGEPVVRVRPGGF